MKYEVNHIRALRRSPLCSEEQFTELNIVFAGWLYQVAEDPCGDERRHVDLHMTDVMWQKLDEGAMGEEEFVRHILGALGKKKERP
jgi:hypothetical protein